jgi:hypothetical protein
MLSQGQSLRGVKGSTILTLDNTAPLIDRGGDIAAFITVDDDYRGSLGVSGQGVIEDLDIDATYSGSLGDISKLHGLYAPARVGSANLHTMRNVGVYNARNDGIRFETGNDKLVCDRLRSERAVETGIYLAGGDVKARAIGSVSTGTALKIDSVAVEVDQFDLWRMEDANLELPTLEVIGGSNGCVIKSGTVEGFTRFIGGNATPGSQYRNSKAQFAFVHFKHVVPIVGDPPLCYLEVRDADLVELVSCKWGVSGNSSPDDIYQYLIMITNSGNVDNNGIVKVIGGSGMLRFLGRDGATNKMRIDATDHICNIPQRLLFEWGRLGAIEMVPPFAVDPLDPLRTHLRCDGTEYNTKDQPFGYLNVDAYFDSWTAKLSDDTTFRTPNLPALSSNCVPAIRAVP